MDSLQGQCECGAAFEHLDIVVVGVPVRYTCGMRPIVQRSAALCLLHPRACPAFLLQALGDTMPVHYPATCSSNCSSDDGLSGLSVDMHDMRTLVQGNTAAEPQERVLEAVAPGISTNDSSAVHAVIEQLREKNAALETAMAALQLTNAVLTKELTGFRQGSKASSAVTFSAEAEVTRSAPSARDGDPRPAPLPQHTAT